ncbi:hypothetical protein Q4555_15635 [Octadecabacter sp. 1_MG-2023]|uniref:hypothetical protein n=1 Tax=unclassified Octadecabacter TaxID=196158 RepID=UPI001C0A0B3C|nr:MULTISPECIES: hypothetical protein [unclassified Octadecabacter]MBU2994037.1 hypothetical protein [Octadecabacter sp. B2R22]MDO6736110.1 hypothetical protein [Octadecabacter sp. 1_MG-2023]
MSKTSTTTANSAGKLYFLNPERIAFQAVLDLFNRAMRHESNLYLSGASIHTDIGTELGDHAAKSWSNCEAALDTLLMMPNLSKLLRVTAQNLQRLLPEHITEDFDYQRCFKAFADKSKTLRKSDHGLADQMMDTALIYHVHEANVKLSKLQRVTVTD